MERRIASKQQRSRRSAITVCLIASLAFWLSIKLSSTYTTTEPIDIEYRLPRGVAFAQQPPTMLEASVSATGWELLLQRFSKQDRAIVVDSLDVRANPDGIISVRRAVAKSFSEAGLAVDAMTNERIVLRTEPVSAKRVPIEVLAEVSYVPGFSATQGIIATPDSVDLTGPKTYLDSISSWPTDTVRLTNVKDTMRATAVLRQPVLPQARLGRQRVSIELASQQFTEKRVYVPVLPTAVGEVDSIKVFPREVLVSFAVGLSDYAKVGRQDFRATVDLSNQQLGKRVVLPVEISRQPANIQRVSTQPTVVEVYTYQGGDQQ